MAACYMGLRGERRKQSTLGVMVHRDSMDATVPLAITVRGSGSLRVDHERGNEEELRNRLG
jgi:hypothetical protein